MPTGKEAPKRKDGKTSFDQLIEYISAPEKITKKNEQHVFSFNVLTLETAGVEMTATAMQNARSHGNSAYHCIITWPTTESPSAAQAAEAGLIALKELGFDTEPGGHQALVAYHHDTQNAHIHICANKIHPQTLKSLQIEFSHKTLHSACRLIEIKQGWSHQKGIKEVVIDADGNEQVIDSQYRNTRNQGISQKALDVEKHSNASSFERYIKEIVGPVLSEELKKGGATWQRIHKLLNEFNVKITQKGGGFAFADMPLFKSNFTEDQKLAEVERAGKAHAKASAAGSFARGGNLIKMLGKFETSNSARELQIFRYNAKAVSGREAVNAEQQIQPEPSEETKDEARLKAVFEQAMLERKTHFQSKKDTRKAELTDVNKAEDRKLQDRLNESRKSAHAVNSNLPQESKLPTPTVNAILKVEREKLKAELKAKQDERDKAFNAEFVALEAKLHKHNDVSTLFRTQS